MLGRRSPRRGGRGAAPVPGDAVSTGRRHLTTVVSPRPSHEKNTRRLQTARAATSRVDTPTPPHEGHPMHWAQGK